jgi:hypothetical protein
MLLSGKFRTICGADVIEVVEVVPVGNLAAEVEGDLAISVDKAVAVVDVGAAGSRKTQVVSVLLHSMVRVVDFICGSIHPDVF